MSVNVESDSDNEEISSLNEQEDLSRHGANSVDDDIRKERMISTADLQIADSISRARTNWSYPEYMTWKENVLENIDALQLSYLLESEDAVERRKGDNQLMRIVFRKISPVKPRDTNWMALWKKINARLYDCDLQMKQNELAIYLNISFDKDWLDWLEQLMRYQEMAKSLDLSHDSKTISEKVLRQNGWENRFEWVNLFQNVSTVDDIAIAIHKAQRFNRYTTVSTPAIVNTVDHKEKTSKKRSKSSNTTKDKNAEKPSKKKTIVCYNCNKKGHVSTNCPERVTENTKPDKGRSSKQ